MEKKFILFSKLRWLKEEEAEEEEEDDDDKRETFPLII